MEIKYNLKKDYFKYKNEALGVLAEHKRLLKKEKAKVRGFIKINIINLLLSFFMAVFLGTILLLNNRETLADKVFFIFGFIIMTTIINLLNMGYQYIKDRGKKDVGTLIIDEEGILDSTSNGIKIGASYDKIKAIVVTKNIIVFILKEPFFVFIDNKDKNKIIKEIKKYSDVQIIDKSK